MALLRFGLCLTFLLEALGQGTRCAKNEHSFVISTRFQVVPAHSPTDYVELFRLTLNSIVAQENQDFKWIVLVDDSTPSSVSRALQALIDPFSNFFCLRNYTLRDPWTVRTILPVGVALHARATAHLNATLRQRLCGKKSPRGLLLGWGAVREWTASAYNALGALRTLNTPELRQSHLDSSTVLCMTEERGTVLAAGRATVIAKVNQTIYLTQYFPLRACHVASASGCASNLPFAARELDAISLNELDRNYNLSFPHIDVLKNKLAPSPIARRSNVSRRQTRGVTLIVQTTCERLWALRATCERWTGPMVIVLFVDLENRCSLADECSSKTLVEVIATPEELAEPTLYPVNRLRNIGIDAANTTHVFVIDADFWPDSLLYSKLFAIATSSSEQEEEQTRGDALRAVIVPSLEVDPLAAASKPEDNRKCKSAQNCPRAFERSVPNDFKSLLACLETGNCYMFDDSRNPEGHGTTDFATWLTQHPTKLRPLECILSPRYEPYFMMRKTDVSPRYDPAFTGYGKNKISLTLQLRLAGYTFSVLPRSFLTHVPHRQSKAKSIFMKSKYLGQERKLKRHRINMSSLYESLQAQLAAAPNGTLPMPMCSRETAVRIRRSNHACRLAALAKQVQRNSPSLHTSANWKRHALGFVHTRTFRKCA